MKFKSGIEYTYEELRKELEDYYGKEPYGLRSVLLSQGDTFLTQTYPEIERVIFSPPATIVFWNDGTKTVVKTSPHDKYDKEKGILWAYFLKSSNKSKTHLQKKIAKLVQENDEKS